MKDKKEKALRRWTLGIASVIFLFMSFLFIDHPEYKHTLNAKYISYHQVSKSLKSFNYEYMTTIKIENGDVIFRRVFQNEIKKNIAVDAYARKLTGFGSYKIVFK